MTRDAYDLHELLRHLPAGIRWRRSDTGVCRHALGRRDSDESVCGIAEHRLRAQALPPPKPGEVYFLACTRCVGGIIRAREVEQLPAGVVTPARLLRRYDQLIRATERLRASARRLNGGRSR